MLEECVMPRLAKVSARSLPMSFNFEELYMNEWQEVLDDSTDLGDEVPGCLGMANPSKKSQAS